MKIAFISTILGYPWGGADTLWTRAAEAANDRGDRLLLSVSTAVASHPRIAALISAGAGVVIRNPVTSPPSLGARVLRKLGLARSPDAALIAALQAFRPDLVILSHGGTYDLVLHPALTAWLRSSGTRYRIIANWQEENPRLDDAHLAFMREAFVAADRLNFVSTRNLTVTRRHLALPLPNAQVIQNPLRWQPADVTPWPAGPVTRLATVSRLDEGKGIQLLLQALTACGPGLPDWQLNIHGQGPFEPQLRAAAAPLGGRVQFRGYVKQLRDIWAENHLMVSPAIEDGVPMTIPEAMLCQRPVLATCVGGAEDWLAHGRTGFLCPAREAGALAATLQEAFAARDRWETMGRAAADAAAGRYRAEDHLLLVI
jgi:glycosyltransferase involved in cell wall biosynthesis